MDTRGCDSGCGVNTAGEFRRGGWLLAGCTLGICAGVSSTYFYSLGLFIGPMAGEFGWGRGAASLGALVGTAAAALASPCVGPLVDRFGSRRVALASMLMLALSFAAMGRVTQGVASFLLCSFLLSLLTIGSGPLPYTRMIVAAYSRHRGLALGIALAGTGLGALLIPRLLNPFIAVHGWRSGYYALSGAVLCALPITAWLLPRATEEVRPERLAGGSLRDVLRNPLFLQLASTFFLVSVAVFGMVVHFVPMLTDWGLRPAEAGAVAGWIGVSAVFSRLLIGRLLDRLAPGVVTAALFLAVATVPAGFALLGQGYAVAGAIGLGLGIGAEVDLLAFLTSRYLPGNLYARAFGLLYALFLLGGAAGPAISGYLRQRLGGYGEFLGLASTLLMLAAAVSSALPRANRKAFTGTSTSSSC